MKHFYLQGFLSLILVKVISGCRGTETVIAVQQEDVALSCLSPNETVSFRYRFQWTKNITGTKELMDIYKWPRNNSEPSKWEVVDVQNGQKCLFLRKSQKSDEGTYYCEMFEAWGSLLKKTIYLKIKDCKTLESVQSASKKFTELNCPVNTTLGPQNVSWAMQKGNRHVSVSSNRAKPSNATLIFPFVTNADDGWYRCSYMLGPTRHCFDIKLQIREEDAFVATTPLNVTTKTRRLSEPAATETSQTKSMEESDAFIALVVVVILAIIIIGALTGLFVHHRHTTQRALQIQQRHFQGNRISMYENVTPLTESLDQVNSLYHMPDDTLVTFK